MSPRPDQRSDLDPVVVGVLELGATLADFVVLPLLLVAPVVALTAMGDPHTAAALASLLLGTVYYATAFEQVGPHRVRGPLQEGIVQWSTDRRELVPAGRPADCECETHSFTVNGEDIPCFPCWKAGFDDPNPEAGDEDDVGVITVE